MPHLTTKYHKLIWNVLLLLLLLWKFTGNKEQGLTRSLWSYRASISESLIGSMSLQVTFWGLYNPCGKTYRRQLFAFLKIYLSKTLIEKRMDTGQILWIRHKEKVHYHDQQAVKGVASFSTSCRPGWLSFNVHILKIACTANTHWPHQ